MSSDDQPQPEVPEELRPWVAERRAELDRIAREDPAQAAALLAVYTDELTALLGEHEAQLAAEPPQDSPAYQELFTLSIDESKIVVTRANPSDC